MELFSPFSFILPASLLTRFPLASRLSRFPGPPAPPPLVDTAPPPWGLLSVMVMSLLTLLALLALALRLELLENVVQVKVKGRGMGRGRVRVRVRMIRE